MAPREALALVRTRSLRPGLSLPSPGRPGRRTVAVAGLVVAGLALLYALARVTPIFAVRAVAVEAPSRALEAETRAVLDGYAGTSLVALDAADVESRLRAVPTVRSASVDRAFPHTLVVRVEGERPLAVVRGGPAAWLVAESGRVVAAIEPGTRRRLPRLVIPVPEPLAPGETLADGRATVALGVLRALPPRLAKSALSVRVESGNVELMLRNRIEVGLGEAVEIDTKLAAAAAVLRALSSEERAGTSYIDASVPERVVVGASTQPVSESLEFSE